ncbi:hypothetical protein AN5432.2 [Paecilomyces variotii No. 5]|uniref:Uncharacterized protein n=1 Tax=Byssochlamys spectabilis (strain No. 5 / NBRC 109023) TaxID=1356009 RepID=V5HWQ5_BYSSN|nr:hypothetical protein AN5432.2 [Paecilomyces variotii No. 5]
MASSEVRTHTYKVTDGLALTIDVTYPPGYNEAEQKTALLHFHGGFLVIGDKTSFTPHWLINVCNRRGWAYVTASYRLLPEATGLDILSDTVDAANWVAANVSRRYILAGSSAGGYLALATAIHPNCPQPLAVLSVYGMLDLTNQRYVQKGRSLRAPVENLQEALGEIDLAIKNGSVTDGYPINPADMPADKRYKWIRAMHEAARIPDILTRIPGLAQKILTQGKEVIPEEYRPLFPAAFGNLSKLPAVALLHGDSDELVMIDQSEIMAEKLRAVGVEVLFEIAAGQGHGFDAREYIDLDSEDAKLHGKDFYTPLSKVISFLEKHSTTA